MLVRVFSDVLVAFLYFDICHYLVANIKIWKSHLNIREGSDYLHVGSLIVILSLLRFGYFSLSLQLSRLILAVFRHKPRTQWRKVARKLSIG